MHAPTGDTLPARIYRDIQIFIGDENQTRALRKAKRDAGSQRHRAGMPCPGRDEYFSPMTGSLRDRGGNGRSGIMSGSFDSSKFPYVENLHLCILYFRCIFH